jgi:hypothetical protein
VVVVGDYFHCSGRFDAALDLARQLRVAGTPETMTALAHFAVGGIEALAAQDNETVLEQMSSA